MLQLRAPGLLGSALSGAGPSVLVFYERGHEEVCQKFRELFARHGHESEILWAHIPDHGYDLLRGL
jgi:homoserine kinase